MTFIVILVIIGVIALIALATRSNSKKQPTSQELASVGAEAKKATEDFVEGLITFEQLRQKLIALQADSETLNFVLAEASRMKEQFADRVASELLQAFICGELTQEQYKQRLVNSGIPRSEVDIMVTSALKMKAQFQKH
jgi:hypothetical protein